MTNKGWNMDKILGKTTTICLIIMMIALMVFGVAATTFGIQSYRDYDALYEDYVDLNDRCHKLKSDRDTAIDDCRSLDDALKAYIKDIERLEREYENYTCLNVSEEYFMELLYNSKESVGIGETSELNNLIDKLLGFVVVD